MVQATKKTRAERKRIPAGSPRLNLSTKGIKAGYRGYWAKADQFDELFEAGYSFTKKGEGITLGEDRSDGSDLGTLISKTKGVETLYLLQIKEAWYKENQAVSQKRIDDTENQIINQEPDAGFYSPSQNKISRGAK